MKYRAELQTNKLKSKTNHQYTNRILNSVFGMRAILTVITIATWVSRALRVS